MRAEKGRGMSVEQVINFVNGCKILEPLTSSNVLLFSYSIQTIPHTSSTQKSFATASLAERRASSCGWSLAKIVGLRRSIVSRRLFEQKDIALLLW